MKVTIIGCWGAYPAPGNATSGYLFECDGFTLLVDCGSGVLSRLQQFVKVEEVDAVLLSHYHHDHVADIGPLQYACLVTNTLNETKNILPIYGHDEEPEKFRSLTHQYTEGVAYDPSRTLQIGPFTIDFQKTSHPVPCYGMKITDGTSTVVYTADTSYTDDWIAFSHQADLLITDTNFYKGMDGKGPGHMTSTEAAHIAAKGEVSTLWLSHLPHFGQLTKLKQEAEDVFSGTIQIAQEGLSWKGPKE
ncbi:MBL fold metallo-hydrolase [Halobacillus yeomjeoni]|uniref:MBL fold metallo-hydrolase n=1 Tax=Halobacillus yeomjeoni TaxID=311194 RepID=A0A931HT00_9BACI|nr:MBL fold metallo-hydrolase [Halobacillus yeomjeoni]MBH0228731.1 MBL fold metallo-hydrolase [Halobacillus yeomjeoni]